MSRGHDRERGLRDFLEELHWVCIRAAGSLGPVDLAAIATEASVYPQRMRMADDELARIYPSVGDILFIECKSTSRPYERFGPAARRRMLELGDSVGAACWLAWKPKFAGHWVWIPSAEWPDANLPKTPSATLSG